MHSYVTRHEDEIVGPFESWEAAQAWLDSLSGDRNELAYIERISDPVETKALWAEWDFHKEGECSTGETRRLKWCAEHKEPVWWYEDESWCCMWQLVTGTGDTSQCAVINEVPSNAMYTEAE